MTHSKALEVSNNELTQFAYIASHDLQAPLRHITGYIDILKNELKELDENKLIKMAIKNIQKSAKKMQDLVSDLLQYSILNKNQTEYEKCNLKETLLSVLELFEKSDRPIESKFLDLDDSTNREISVHKSQFFQLIQNLFSNSFKYKTPDNPLKIKVSCVEDDKNFLVKFSDNGIGIPEKFHKKVFKVFERLHTESQYPGTGIGLAICEKIVQNHGGEISISLEPELQGTTIIFTIKKQ